MGRLFAVLLIPFALAFAQNPKIPKEALVGYQAISASDLKARLSFIASPELEGRETTFRGQKVAARYIASEFQRIGLKPIGDSGTYFQHFVVEATKMTDNSTISITTKQGTIPFLLRKDFLALSAPGNSMIAPAIFVGHMDTKVDSNLTKGRIVVALLGRRGDSKDTNVTPRQRLGFIRPFTGSIATLLVADDTGSNSMRGLSPRIGSLLDNVAMKILGAVTSGRRGFVFPTLISPRLANEILRESGKSLSQVRQAAAQDSAFQPISLNQTTISIEITESKEIKTTENVLGLLEGSDPILKDEIVAFTAHYDHLGILGGVVNPGADDDGSGTVTVLELAQAFAKNPVKPKRSLLFMTVVGEEKGLLGSDWYVNHPVIPLEKTIADLNTDMIGRVDKKYEERKDSNYVYVIGSHKISTQLDSVLHLSNTLSENLVLDYTYNDDRDLNRFYSRSDHYNFAKNGVPIVFFFTGVHADYHKPTDTIDKILFPRMARIVRLIYTTGWQVANAQTGLAKNVQSSMFSK
jgi:hypothetical protein